MPTNNMIKLKVSGIPMHPNM